MKRKGIFFTSDWHVGHSNVIKYSNRPFKNVDHMERVLINNYNAAVSPEDVCYFLGDMGLCANDRLSNVLSQLNGTKVLLLGNHDKGVNSMYDIGFDVVLHNLTLYIANHRVTASHCPLNGVYRENTEGMSGSTGSENWHGEGREKHNMLTVTNEGQFHLHGHIHSPNGGKSKTKEGKQYDVGVDGNKYRPVSISNIESWINTYGISKS